jgi:hypothetical protein
MLQRHRLGLTTLSEGVASRRDVQQLTSSWRFDSSPYSLNPCKSLICKGFLFNQLELQTGFQQEISTHQLKALGPFHIGTDLALADGGAVQQVMSAEA